LTMRRILTSELYVLDGAGGTGPDRVLRAPAAIHWDGWMRWCDDGKFRC
jgi:hypothetical protein